jgi:5-methylcytosine-specific restriction endonuclease McrA
MAYRKRHRGTTTQRLGRDHAPDRRRLMAAHRDGDLCWRCGQPMYKWQALERDHITPRTLGGTDGPAVLAHAHCNRSAGAILGNQMRGARQPGWFTSRRW